MPLSYASCGRKISKLSIYNSACTFGHKLIWTLTLQMADMSWLLEFSPTQITFIIFIFTIIITELLFYVYVIVAIIPSVQPLESPHAHKFKDPVDIMREVFLMLETISSYDFKKWVSGMFKFCKFEEIYSDNFREGLSWVTYLSGFDSLTLEQKDIILALRSEALERFNINMPEGYNPDIEHVNFSLEPVKYMHKPLLLYALLNFLEVADLLILFFSGFHLYTLPNGLTYWYKPEPASSASSIGANSSTEESRRLLPVPIRPPILLFHGICPGWGYYSNTIRVHSDRAVILFNYRCIFFSWISLDVPGPQEVSEAVSLILATHKIPQVSIIAHSWGTFLAGWVVRLRPDLVSHLTLVEPICLTLILFETTFTILYKPPVSFADYLLYYFVRHDISVSNTLHRNFAWYNMFLRYEDIPDDIPVIVSFNELDELICSEAVDEITDNYLLKRKEASSGSKIVAPVTKFYWAGYRHGDTPNDLSVVEKLRAAAELNEALTRNYMIPPQTTPTAC